MTKYKILSIYTHNNTHLYAGHYGGINGIITLEHIEQYEKIYNLFKDNKLKSNTSVYITPLSQYPSYKLKNYSEELQLNITTTRKFKNLNTLIIDDSFIRDSYYPSNKDDLKKEYYVVPHQFIIDNFSKYIDTKNDWNNLTLERNYSEHYLVPKEDLVKFANIDKDFLKFREFPTLTGFLIHGGHGSKKASEHIDFFKNLTNLIEEYNLDIVFDNVINNDINNDMAIDLDVFKTLFSMLSSDDADNYSIAKEIASNCNFEESKPYILFLSVLFSEFRIKSSQSKNWKVLHTQILKYKKYLGKWFSSRNNLEPTDIDFFIKNFIPDYPQYRQIVCNCLTIYFNHKFGTDLIKEIQST
jgi:hypothetical protein